MEQKAKMSLMARIQSLFGSQDMTQGSTMKCLLKFAVPLLIGNFAQQLYSTVDSIIVGQYVGDEALAAVGASLPAINLLFVLFMAISTGTGIMVAQYFGAKEKKLLSQTIGTSIVLIAVSSLLMSVLGIMITRPLMTLLGTPANIYNMACEYMVIIFIGLIGSGFYNIISGILRGLGDSFYPLVFLLVATILNIALDLLFVITFDMGVAGVAWATIIAQGVSAILCLIKLANMRDMFTLNLQSLKINWSLGGQLMRLGLPSGLTQAIFSMAMVFVQSLSNSMGSLVISCSTMVMRVDGFAMLPNFTFGMALSTFIGQNIGAKKLDRVNRGSKEGLLLAVATSVILTAILLFFGHHLLRLFTGTEEIIQLGVRQLRILAAGYIAMAFTQTYSGIMRGAGDTMPAMWISLITTVIIRVPIAYIWAFFTRVPRIFEAAPQSSIDNMTLWLSRQNAYVNGSPDALFFSLLISWVLGAVFTYAWYRRGKWRDKSLV